MKTKVRTIAEINTLKALCSGGQGAALLTHLWVPRAQQCTVLRGDARAPINNKLLTFILFFSSLMFNFLNLLNYLCFDK